FIIPEVVIPDGYDLHLMSVDKADGLVKEGRSLVIVALVGTELYVRIFDAKGATVVDKTEKELVSGEKLTALKGRLKPDESGLSEKQKQEFIWDATSIAGHTLPDRNPVQVKIPIPIRVTPIPPTVDKQGIGSAYPGRDNLKIEETRQYAYSYQYSRMRSGHDLVYTSPRFNSSKQDPKAAPRSGETRMDLFQALAKFDRAWDQIRQDLVLTLPKVEPGKPDVNAEKALEAFANLVSEVRDAWRSWREDRSERYNEKYQRERLKLGESLYVISEMANKQYPDEPWEIIVRKCNGVENDPIPAIDIEGWTQVEIKPPNRNERRFQFVANVTEKDVEEQFNIDKKLTRMTEKDVEAKLNIDNKLTRT
ncbi:MAG: hypothetical protein ACREBC_36320, partial [Pyrinomonadaceae bacterium]